MRAGEKKYPHIFSPLKIGPVTVKNRIKYASTETNFNTRDGFVTDVEVGYMEAQAKGGAGIVTTQGAFTDPRGEGKGYVGMMGIWDDKYIPGLKRIADAIKSNGSVSCLQLMHCGRVGGVELEYTVGPSAVPQKLPRFRPQREMSVEEIKQCIQEHVDGARRAVEAGFEMVEISGIVGYLVSNFISSYTNIRTDEYGGDIVGRCRFMREIIEGCRKAIGPNIALGIRLCGEEKLEDRGGNTPEESLQAIKIAEQAGCDFLSVTVGWQESAISVITRDVEMGHWLYVAERMKKNVNIPVSMAYRLFVPELPEKAMAEGKLDLWEMCRPMIADPAIPNKIAEDRQEDIIPCMACNLCLARLFRDQPIICMVRPNLAHERDKNWGYYGFPEADEKKRVIVIGGGPSGMQCAAVAARRGHDVTLWEKSDKLGGQLAVAAKGPYGDDEFQRLIDYLAVTCKKSGVKIELNKAASPKDFADPLHNPDVVVLASGASASVPDVPGARGDNVISAFDAMSGAKPVGKKVAILGGTGVAIATAIKLASEEHEVTMIDTARKLGRDVNPSYIWRYVKKLKGANVVMMTESKVKEITATGVVAVGPQGEVTVEADTVIGAVMESNKQLVEALEFGCGELHIIGDAVTPRRAHNATADGYKAGMRI